MELNPNKFWNNKILSWEKDKYGKKLFDVNTSVKMRMQIAKDILKKHVAGKTVMEIGCGSALLAEEILSFGAKRYIGIDISNVAIEAAKNRLANNSDFAKVDLRNVKIQDITSESVDVCFSLGLFDWISLQDINNLKNKVNSKSYFHSFSEKRPMSVQQQLHRLYVFVMYGHKTQKYVPQYFSENEIKTALEVNDSSLSFLRHPKLSFGCIVNNLNITSKDFS